MKRILVLGILVVVISGVSIGQVKFGGGVQGGVVFPSFPSETKDYYSTGYSFGAHGDVTVIKYFTGRLSFDYTMIPSDKKKFAELLAQGFTVGGQPADPSQITVTGWNFTDMSFSLTGIGKLPLGSIFTPYALVGFGIHILKATDPTVSYTGVGDITTQLVNFGVIVKGETKTKFGLHFGLGGEVSVGIARIYLEFKYVMIFTEGKNTGLFPLMVGVTF